MASRYIVYCVHRNDNIPDQVFYTLYCCNESYVTVPLYKYQGATTATAQHKMYTRYFVYCHTILLGTTFICTNEPNCRRHTKNKVACPSCRASCEIPLDHAHPCEPSKNTRASTVSLSPNVKRIFVTSPADTKTRSDAVDESRIARYFWANLPRVGYANWCRHHY